MTLTTDDNTTELGKVKKKKRIRREERMLKNR